MTEPRPESMSALQWIECWCHTGYLCMAQYTQLCWCCLLATSLYAVRLPKCVLKLTASSFSSPLVQYTKKWTSTYTCILLEQQRPSIRAIWNLAWVQKSKSKKWKWKPLSCSNGATITLCVRVPFLFKSWLRPLWFCWGDQVRRQKSCHLYR